MATAGIRAAAGASAPAGLTTAGLTAATMVAFASNSLLCRAALDGNHADAATFTLLRLSGGAVALGLLARALGSPQPSARGAWGSAVALFAYAIAFSLAYRRVPAGVGALLLFAAVQLTMVVAALRTGERPRALEWAGHALSIAGVVVLTRPGLVRADPAGAALMVVAGAAWGVYSLMGRGGGPAVARNAAGFARAVPLALVAAGIGVSLGAMHVDPAGAGLALVSGAIASGLGYALWYAALRGLTATRAALVQLSVPPLAAAGGVLLLGEVLSARLLLSGALVLGGIALAVAGRARRAARLFVILRRMPDTRRPLTLVLPIALAAATAPAIAQTSAAPAPDPRPEEALPFRISGLVYADYYDVARSHRDELEGENGFWIRRLYFTYDHTLSKALSLRVRLEVNSEGDFESTGVNTPYLKDAWLKWAFGAHALTFGLAPTANIDFVDAFQGYRSVEKSPLDLHRWDSSRDLGILLQGALGEEQRTRYSFQFGNGSGTGSETDAGKAVRGELVHRFGAGLVLEGYADWQDLPDGRDVSTLQAFAGWQASAWRASLQYGRQDRRESGPGGSDLALDFVSAFAAVQVAPRVTFLGRLDRNFDPIPNGETIDYMPFSAGAKSAFGLVGVDVTLAKTVHLIPNVEVTRYDEAADGTRPGVDVVPRVTLFFSW